MVGGSAFHWDEENRNHVAHHGVTPEECEQVLLGDPAEIDYKVEDGEERIVLAGPTLVWRFLIVVVALLPGDRLRVATAYPASEATTIRYLRERGMFQ